MTRSLHFRRRSRWREIVCAKATSLEGELAKLTARANACVGVDDVGRLVKPVTTNVCNHLKAAKEAAAPRHRGVGPLWQVVAGGEGAAIDAAFTNLHAAKVAMVDLYG
jgi:hypothetical protein